jgi:hypothetical protein
MKSTMKMIGIIAVTAIIGFTFFACGDPPEEDNSLKGKVTITDEYGDTLTAAIPGTELFAEFSVSTEEVTFQWQKGPWEALNSQYEDIEGETEDSYTANAPGRYRVKAISKSDPTDFKTSDYVIIAEFAAFLGTFYMTGTATGGDPATVNYNEIAEISEKRISVRDDYTGITPPDPLKIDMFDFEISGWEKVTFPVTPVNPSGALTGYTLGYKLTGTVDEDLLSPGYNTMNKDTTTLIIYLKPGAGAAPAVMRRSWGNGTKTSDNTARDNTWIIPRDYVKQ